MKVILFLSNQNVQIVVGKKQLGNIVIERTVSVQAPEHSIINGVVTDQDVFMDFIKKTFETYKISTKNITLVLNSTKFVGNQMVLSKTGPIRMLANVEKDFTDIDRTDARIYGYTEISSDGSKVKVYAQSAPLEYIENYYLMFKEAKFHIYAIYSGQESLIRFITDTVAKENENFVLMLKDTSTLYTLLWTSGEMAYFNSNHLISERGQELSEELADGVRKLFQFMKANQLSEHVEKIFLSGFEKDAPALLTESLRNREIYAPAQLLKVKKGITLQDEEQFNECLGGISGMAPGTDNENFLDEYLYSRKKKRSVAGIKQYLSPIVISICVMAVFLSVLLVVKAFKESKLDNLNNQLSRSEISMRYDALSAQNDELYATMNAYADVIVNLDTYPQCDSTIWGSIQSAAEGLVKIELEGFEDFTGVLSMTAIAGDVSNINKFITNLRNLGIFYEVDYTGYSFSSAANGWDVHVSCILDEKEGE